MHNHEPDGYCCPFCRILASEEERAEEVILQNEYAIACVGLHHYPNSGPNILVIPKVHSENIYDIDNGSLLGVVSLAKEVSIRMKQIWDIDGVTIQQNNEPAGFQEVWHFHLHVNGRIRNDGMGSSKMIEIPRSQRETWRSEFRVGERIFI